MVISFVALARVWQRDGVNEDNRLSTSFSELWVYPIPAGLYLIKNLMQARPKLSQLSGHTRLRPCVSQCAVTLLTPGQFPKRAVLHFSLRRRPELPNPKEPQHHFHRYSLQARPCLRTRTAPAWPLGFPSTPPRRCRDG